MTTLFTLFVSIGICLAWIPLVRLPRGVRGTTLTPAVGWTIFAAALWTFAWMSDSVGNRLSKSAADHLWYAIAVVSLCPPISVLGCRRPGTKVWTWFILIPMLLTLGWPVITLWIQGSDVRGLQLESPQLMGFLLVTIMGAGNYFGTRYTVPGLLYVAANSLLVVTSSAICPPWLADRWWARLWATGGIAIAVILAGRSASQRFGEHDRFSRVWLDFFDQFGIVWGRRIQDRVNFIADKEGWPARLQLQGIKWKSLPDAATEARVEHTFRWLLRRFVDPSWIDERLGTRSDKEIAALSADS